ncbi:MAG: CehA/McbA family metallohydrolase [Polyangiaceae bacterium]
MRRSFFSRASSSRPLPSLAISALLLGALAGTSAGCNDEETATTGGSGGAGGTGGTGGETATCTIPEVAFETGDAKGHADVFGAKAAGQARAGRIDSEEDIVQPAHDRQKIHVGDYWLANDKIAVAIEDKGLSDGYARFGGEILAVDRVGDDGRPMGVSYYNETLLGLSIEMIDPTSVAVLKDGSDGGDAIVRVVGVTKPIPFLEGPTGALFPNRFSIESALDYVLSPGSEKVVLRLSVVNRGPDQLDFGANKAAKDELFGFFHYSRSQLYTEEFAFAQASGLVEWVGFDSGPSSFAFRTPDGKIEYGLKQSGFALFWGPGFLSDPCTITTHDHVEVISGGPGLDGLREAVRRSTGGEAWTEIKGTVADADGAAVAGAWVHELSADGKYLSRTKTGDDGSYALHAPPGQAVKIVPQKQGYPAHAGVEVAAGTATQDLAFDAHALIHVTATEEGTGEPLPVRIQVIPSAGVPGVPAEWGVDSEANGRLYQEFSMGGDSTLVVPPGDHHIIVSRGYEWELFEADVSAKPGKTEEVAVSLLHSVDTTGRMCGDFHIHSVQSADSNDSVEHKVKGAIADGLDIPVSTEHEWVTDFQPVVEKLGMQKWARGVSAEELTTFAWGHFGVGPLTPKDAEVNRGAIEWIGKNPPGFFDDVRKHSEDPYIIVNHPRGLSLGAYFSAAQYDRDLGAGKDKELWSTNFDAIEVFNDSDFEKNRDAVVADWFSLLNHGQKRWAVGSSDSHHLRTSPVGYPRTCMYFGHDDPTKVTLSGVRDAVRSGDTTISGGLYMTVLGPGGEHPGQTATVDANGEATFTVTVDSPSWLKGETLETIVNGVTVSTEPLLPLGAGPSNKFVNQVTVKLDASAENNWVVFHAKGEGDLSPLHPGRKPFAVSNPVFLEK